MKFLVWLLLAATVMALPPTCGEYVDLGTEKVTMGNVTMEVPLVGHPWAGWVFVMWVIQVVLFVPTMPLFLWRGFRGHSPLRNRLFVLGGVSGMASMCVLTIITALINGWTPFPPRVGLHAFLCVCVTCFFLPFFLRIIRLFGLMQFNLGQYQSVLDDADDADFEAQAIGQDNSSLIVRELKKERTHMLLLVMALVVVILLDIVGSQAIPEVFRGTPLETIVGHTPFFVYLQFLIKVVIEVFLMFGIGVDLFVFFKHRTVLTDSSHILLELSIAMGIFVVEWILSVTLMWAPSFKAVIGFPPPVCANDEFSDLCFIKPKEFNALGGNALNDTCEAWEINTVFTYFCLWIVYHVVVTFPLVMSYVFGKKLERFKLTNVKFELEDLRADPRAHDLLVKFVASEFAFENYAFIDAVSRFKMMSATNPNLEAAARKVAARFIGIDAPLQVNISAHSERRIKRDFQKGYFAPTMFERAVRELRPMFQHDIIPRFLSDHPQLTNNVEIKKMAVQRIAEEKRERERANQQSRSRSRGRRGRSHGRKHKSRSRSSSKK